MSIRSSVALAALAVLLLVACSKSEPSPGAVAPPVQGKINVVVGDQGFQPADIKLQRGQAATLVFKRTTDDTCATQVEFPELKLKKELPLNQEVAIDIPTGEARTFGFQCGMGMYKSKIVVQ